ncbi:MAG TPA: protoporphyrinogen oxidase [Ktedonosporobacter sp.]|jgi:oxygen-dependent protoporphyrinogen oxidase|nr:protoporphyrinogen oxidase [Ktedonosporobacter sp.]
MPEPLRVAVVGGGIAGLSAAYYLTRHNENSPQHITLIEADGRLGGKISTEPFADMPLDRGPDAFLARVPWVTKLCRELGLESELIAPATGKTWIWTRGRLRELPEGLVFGIPTRILPIARSGILSPRGVMRAGLDLVLPRTSLPEDPSVAQVVGSRFGSEAVERLVEPLLGGIHAGRADRLSLAAVVPHLVAATQQHRSLIAGLRKQRAPANTSDAAIFLSLSGGLERLVERIKKELRDVDVQLNNPATSIMRRQDGRYCIKCANGPDVIADGIVLGVPAWEAANMLQSSVPEAASELREVQYSSVAVVTLGYEPSAFPRPLDGSGFLAPRVDNHLHTACSWATNKWPELRRSGLIILRCSTGRLGDDRPMKLDDDELVKRLHGELVEAMGVQAYPVKTRVARWPRSFAQYESGHKARIERVEAKLAELPGIILAGSAYHGSGLAACVHDGELAATQVQTYLNSRGAL